MAKTDHPSHARAGAGRERTLASLGDWQGYAPCNPLILLSDKGAEGSEGIFWKKSLYAAKTSHIDSLKLFKIPLSPLSPLSEVNKYLKTNGFLCQGLLQSKDKNPCRPRVLNGVTSKGQAVTSCVIEPNEKTESGKKAMGLPVGKARDFTYVLRE